MSSVARAGPPPVMMSTIPNESWKLSVMLRTRMKKRAECGVKRNIPGRCGNALARNGNPGWGDGGRDTSGAGGTGAAGRAQGRGAELARDRAGARPGGVDDQPRAAATRSEMAVTLLSRRTLTA